MTKNEFREWFQGLMSERIDPTELLPEDDYGDLWRQIEDEGLLEEMHIPYAVDRYGHDFIFKLDDGYLALGFQIGIEGETQVYIGGGEAKNALRDYTAKDLDTAIGAARVTLNDLTILSSIL